MRKLLDWLSEVPEMLAPAAMFAGIIFAAVSDEKLLALYLFSAMVIVLVTDAILSAHRACDDPACECHTEDADADEQADGAQA